MSLLLESTGWSEIHAGFLWSLWSEKGCSRPHSSSFPSSIIAEITQHRRLVQKVYDHVTFVKKIQYALNYCRRYVVSNIHWRLVMILYSMEKRFKKKSNVEWYSVHYFISFRFSWGYCRNIRFLSRIFITNMFMAHVPALQVLQLVLFLICFLSTRFSLCISLRPVIGV